ncbi:ABC transporter ATP-binding protein/permease [Frateuria aurantia]
MSNGDKSPGYDPGSSGHVELQAPRASFMSILAPYWKSEEKWLSLLLLLVMLAFNFSGVYFGVWRNHWTGKFYNAIGAKHFDQMSSMMMSFLLILLVSGISVVLAFLVNNAVQIRWRTWLTRYLVDHWMMHRNYHRIERDHLLDNADQRISEDVKQFVTSTMTLGSDVLQMSVSTVTYTLLLYRLTGTGHLPIFGQMVAIPGYMVMAAYAYTIGTLLLTHGIGRRLVGININQQQVEAFFRVHMVRIRDDSEQIAFYRGAGNEKRRLLQSFEDIRLNFWRLTRVSTSVLLATTLYGDVAGILPTILILPRLASGQLTVGGLMQISGAFGMLISTTSFFSQAYQSIASWWAVTNRLRELLYVSAQGERSEIQIRHLPHNEVGMQQLTLRRPDGEVMLELEQLRFQPGHSYLITGFSGTGKSTLFRAIAGIWPYGRGQISLPSEATLMFVPQKSYVPDGTLKDVLTYPRPASDFTDAQCLRILHISGLARYAADLNERDRWQRRLSGGEQQRIAMGRVFLLRPDYVFLDEVTSALDAEGTRQLYQQLQQELPSTAVISIGHSPLLHQFHTSVLDLSATTDDTWPELLEVGPEPGENV